MLKIRGKRFKTEEETTPEPCITYRLCRPSSKQSTPDTHICLYIHTHFLESVAECSLSGVVAEKASLQSIKFNTCNLFWKQEEVYHWASCIVKSIKLLCICCLRFSSHGPLLFIIWVCKKRKQAMWYVYWDVTCWPTASWQKTRQDCVVCVWPSSKEMTPACDWVLQ